MSIIFSFIKLLESDLYSIVMLQIAMRRVRKYQMETLFILFSYSAIWPVFFWLME